MTEEIFRKHGFLQHAVKVHLRWVALSDFSLMRRVIAGDRERRFFATWTSVANEISDAYAPEPDQDMA